jgi:hypothetical protein
MSRLPNFLAKRPHGAEYDLSGVVVAKHASVTSLKEGDEVFGWIDLSLQKKSKQGKLLHISQKLSLANDLHQVLSASMPDCRQNW